MAQNDAGMFESLGLNPVEDPQQREMYRQRMQQSGQRSGQALGGLWRALADKLQGGKFRPGEVIDRHEKDLRAKRMGLSGVDELNDIQRIKDLAGRENFGDARTPEARIKMAEFIAAQARKSGNLSVRAKAMAQIQAIREEERQARKEKAQNERAEAEADRAEALAHEDQSPDIWLKGEQQARAAQRASWIDPVTGKRVVGMEYFDDNGELVRVPVGQYSTQDPSEAAARRALANKRGQQEHRDTIGTAWGRNTSPKDTTKLKDMVTTSLQATRIMDRVMDTVKQVTETGRASGVVGKIAPSWNVAFDEVSRGVNGLGNIVQRSFPKLAEGWTKDEAPQEIRENSDGSVGTWSGKDYWTGPEGVVADDSHPIWDLIQIPEAVRGDAALTQNYRAQIMELMYMTARLAEPSNRGLSDNDIINAAKRLGGDTGNPAVLMGRFAEMMYDSIADIENNLDAWYGAVEFEDFAVAPGMTKRAMFDRFIGGGKVEKIRENMAKIAGDHNFSIDEHGRAHFQNPYDDYVNPNETNALSPSTHVGPTREAAQTLGQEPAEESDEVFLLNF